MKERFDLQYALLSQDIDDDKTKLKLIHNIAKSEFGLLQKLQGNLVENQYF